MKTLSVIFFFLLLTLSSSVFASYRLITYYGAQIANDDRVNSNHVRLKTVRDVLRQNRANFYLFGLRNKYDMADGYFNTKSHREMFDTAPLYIDSKLAQQIVYSSGSVYITVYVYSPSAIKVVSGWPKRAN